MRSLLLPSTVLCLASCAAGRPSGGDRAPDGPHRHEMHHRFQGAEAWAKEFDAPSRDAWQKPDAVVAALALLPTSRVADLGAGTGYFTMRIARIVSAGKVWAVDIEPDMARYLRERAAREGLANVEAVLATTDDPRLVEPVDVVLVVDTYHHLERRAAYLPKLVTALAPGGRIVVVDFKMGELPVGPPEHARVTPKGVDREMAAAGLRRLSLDVATLPHQYIAVYAR